VTNAERRTPASIPANPVRSLRRKPTRRESEVWASRILISRAPRARLIAADQVIPHGVELWAWSPAFRTLAQCWISGRSVVCVAGPVGQGVQIQVVLGRRAKGATRREAERLQKRIGKLGWCSWIVAGKPKADLAPETQLMEAKQ
jgi:hypothetical protein